jgi:hypothetical protein
MPKDSVNIEKHIEIYLLHCNTQKNTVTMAHKIKFFKLQGVYYLEVDRQLHWKGKYLSQ